MEGVNKPPTLKIKGVPNVNWTKWYNTFETFLSASGLDEATEKRKIALLLNLIGEDAQELMNNFVWATAEERGNFRAVVNKFKDYCQPLKNITIERFNFNSIG
ncbi:hypothetical protein TcasGA2_TC002234 [Tribolium castaneum]|uniref:Uncharacterized protein n=1 Tax=Tribolium castaneum TaxID=7070 RepID=D7GXU0_TRICA|nr:hypothetical protein TcasGA2_TC002234 [Tribolium castaneum]